jgi:hypothetical protein
MGTTCVAVMPQRNVGEVQHVIGLFLRPSPPPLERTDQLAIEARVFILLPQRTCISLRLPCLMAPVLPVPQVLVADYWRITLVLQPTANTISVLKFRIKMLWR